MTAINVKNFVLLPILVIEMYHPTGNRNRNLIKLLCVIYNETLGSFFVFICKVIHSFLVLFCSSLSGGQRGFQIANSGKKCSSPFNSYKIMV